MGRRRQPFRYLTQLPVAEIAPLKQAAAEALEPADVQALSQSLRRRSQQDPVLVTPLPERRREGKGYRYRLIAGPSRLAAAQQLGWSEIAAVILDRSFSAELDVIERLQANDYDPWELAHTLGTLQERCAWTQAQLGAAIGRNRDYVTGLLAIRDIAPPVRAYLESEGARLSARHLRYIGRATPGRQMKVARDIVMQGLSTKLLEQRQRKPGGKQEFIKVRDLKELKLTRGPRTTVEWRRYYRKLRTDLRRVDEQESKALRRSSDAIEQARQRQRQIRREARVKRQMLDRELRRATKQLERRQRGAS